MRLIDADLFDEVLQNAQTECKKNGGNFRYGVLSNVRANLAKMPTAGGWISVKDRLPEENVAVNIVWVNTDPESYYEDIKGKSFTATGVYFRGAWYWWSSVVQDYLAEYGVGFTDKMDKAITVTHWMPLPEKPKEEEHD